MIVLYKEENVVFSSSKPEEVLDFLLESLTVFRGEIYDKIPTTAGIAEALSNDPDYSVPFLDFFSFLEYHEALEGLLIASKEQNTTTTSFHLLCIKDKEDYINSLFNWANTSEGFEYWAYIDNLWLQECKNDSLQ